MTLTSEQLEAVKRMAKEPKWSVDREGRVFSGQQYYRVFDEEGYELPISFGNRSEFLSFQKMIPQLAKRCGAVSLTDANEFNSLLWDGDNGEAKMKASRLNLVGNSDTALKLDAEHFRWDDEWQLDSKPIYDIGKDMNSTLEKKDGGSVRVNHFNNGVWRDDSIALILSSHGYTIVWKTGDLLDDIKRDFKRCGWAYYDEDTPYDIEKELSEEMEQFEQKLKDTGITHEIVKEEPSIDYRYVSQTWRIYHKDSVSYPHNVVLLLPEMAQEILRCHKEIERLSGKKIEVSA